jgi:hypothetical protein
VVRHVVQEMPIVTQNDVRVWFPYNLVAFSLIPVAIRPATTSFMEAGWQTYISLCSHSYHPPHDDVGAQVVHNNEIQKQCAGAAPPATLETIS